VEGGLRSFPRTRVRAPENGIKKQTSMPNYAEQTGSAQSVLARVYGVYKKMCDVFIDARLRGPPA